MAQLKPEDVDAMNLPDTARDLEADLLLSAARHESIAAYAAAMAGSDLDADLETAGIECLTKTRDSNS
jgi:hypothetical protein